MSVNDFNRGVVSQCSANEAFERKQGDAIAELGKRIIQKIDQNGMIVDVLVDELNQRDLESNYGISRSPNVSSLDNSDQIKLLSYLKTLIATRGQNTDQQYDYFYAVKRHLNISSVSDNMNLKSISELDISRSELIAFLECVCEFLFLKRCNREFLNTFKDEIDCFGLNDKIINGIVSNIEKTYEKFGIRDIIEHYCLEPIKQDVEKTEQLVIPFFEKPIIIIYDEKEKHHKDCAEKLMGTIKERLKEIGAKDAEIATINEKDAKLKLQHYEATKHIIYIGIPDQAKSLLNSIKWEFNKFGMRYGTFGDKTIITAYELRKNERKAFIEYVKQNAKEWESKVNCAAKNSETCTRALFTSSEEAGSKGVAAATNITMATVFSPLVLLGAAFDLFTHEGYKKELLMLQLFIAIDSFVNSKIEAVLNEKTDN